MSFFLRFCLKVLSYLFDLVIRLISSADFSRPFADLIRCLGGSCDFPVSMTARAPQHSFGAFGWHSEGKGVGAYQVEVTGSCVNYIGHFSQQSGLRPSNLEVYSWVD